MLLGTLLDENEIVMFDEI